MDVRKHRKHIRPGARKAVGRRTHRREYASWMSMKQRCLNPNCDAYHHYGGRGITVCERWADFGTFLEDMGPRPAGTSLDRIDNSKGYEPGNCRWATAKTQRLNSRQNVMLTIYGMSRNIPWWSEISGIDPPTIRDRLERGWAEKRAVFQPKNYKEKVRNG